MPDEIERRIGNGEFSKKLDKILESQVELKMEQIKCSVHVDENIREIKEDITEIKGDMKDLSKRQNAVNGKITDEVYKQIKRQGVKAGALTGGTAATSLVVIWEFIKAFWSKMSGN